MVTVAAAPLGHVSKVAMKRKLPSSGTMDGVEMLTVSTPFIAQLRSVALVVRDSNDNGGKPNFQHYPWRTQKLCTAARPCRCRGVMLPDSR